MDLGWQQHCRAISLCGWPQVILVNGGYEASPRPLADSDGLLITPHNYSSLPWPTLFVGQPCPLALIFADGTNVSP